MNLFSKPKNILVILVIVSFLFSCTKSHSPKSVAKISALSGKYIGQIEPDSIPSVFAPNFVSSGYNERDVAFSPDGKEFYYTLIAKTKGVIVFVKEVEGKWTKPEIVSFSGAYSDVEPNISHDGEKLFFASDRPLSKNDTVNDFNILFVEREGSHWSEPESVGEKVNSDANEFYPCLTLENTLYFTAQLRNTFGGEDIFKSKLVDGEYQQPENLGRKINSKGGDFNAFVAPDESYLIYSTFRRGEGFGGSDLHISFKNEDGSWTFGKNMGGKINSESIDYCPALSPDGKYFFFSSRRVNENIGEPDELTYNKLTKILDGPENGSGDIYWVNSDFIMKLKNN